MDSSIPEVVWRTPAAGGGRRRFLVAAAAAAVVLISVWVLMPFPGGDPGIEDPGDGRGPVAGERWSKQWDEFVSGAEARGDLTIDPFAIPDPEVIDF